MTITRDEALDLLHEHMGNVNLRRHCHAVEAVMRALAKHFGEDEDTWGIAGLLHDADYEELKGTERVTTDHTKLTIEWLKKMQGTTDISDTIASHAWGYVEDAPKPTNKMQWSLYCSDELTGLIVAVALVKNADISVVTVDSVMKKWKEKSFAAGANREQIEKCEEYLKIPLREFIEIALRAMQQISSELGL